MADNSRNALGAPKSVAEKSNQLRAVVLAPDFQKKLSAAIAKNTGLTPARLSQQALTTAYQTPQLLDCSPVSVLMGIMRAAELSLELAGPLGQAWLVPRYDWKTRGMSASFQIGYKGYIALAYRTGVVKRFTPRIVYEKDHFEIRYGRDQGIVHSRGSDADRGKAVHYYAEIELTNGGYDFHDMSISEIKAHRLRFSPPPAGKEDKSAWATNFDAMAMKTCASALGRRAPLAVELYTAASDEAAEERTFIESEEAAPETTATSLLEQRMSESLAESQAAPEPVGSEKK